MRVMRVEGLFIPCFTKLCRYQ